MYEYNGVDWSTIPSIVYTLSERILLLKGGNL